MRKYLFSALIAVILSCSDLWAVQELYPFDIVGRIVNAENIAYDATSGVQVFADDMSGRRLATTKVMTAGTLSPWNFVLEIPVADAPTPGYVTKGENVRLTALVGDRTYKATLDFGDQVIGDPGDAVCLRMMFAEDVNGNGIADSYEDAMLDQMWALGMSGDYDPDADYDGDGASNRAEYLAGTDPFLASDRFAARAIDVGAEGFFGLEFEANAGRTYSVKESVDLKNWKRMDINLEPAPDDVAVGYLSTAAREWAVRTVYLLRDGPKHFYRVELNDEQIDLDK